MFDLSVACAGLVAILCASVLYRYWKKHAVSLLPLPPSPKPYPLIGNLLSMPSKDEHVGFLEIGKDLNSDIYSMSVFGTLIIVLNSSEHTTNLLEKRAGIYSDRICPPMSGEPSLVDWGNFPTILGYNDQWRKGRRLLHPWLHKKATERFQPAQKHQAHLLLQRLLNSSDHMRGSEELDVELYSSKYPHKASAATLADSVYGYKVESSNDQFVLNIKQALTNVGETALPSNFLVNLFPVLVHVPDWFPGTAWKQIAREWRVHQKNAVNAPYQWAKEQIAKGSHEPYITLAMLDQAERLGMEKNEAEELIKQLDVALFGVGAETTATVLMHFVLAMLLFPETQEAAQKEIDSVVGTNRLPSMDDRPKLEYVECLLQEVLRWRPVLPNGVHQQKQS